MKRTVNILSIFFILLCFAACGRAEQTPTVTTEKEETAIIENQTENEMTTTKTRTQIAQTGV